MCVCARRTHKRCWRLGELCLYVPPRSHVSSLPVSLAAASTAPLRRWPRAATPRRRPLLSLAQALRAGARSLATRYPSYLTNVPATEVTTLANGVRVATEVRLGAAQQAARRWRAADAAPPRPPPLPAPRHSRSSHALPPSPLPGRAATARRRRWACSSMRAAATRLPRTMARRTSWSTLRSRCAPAPRRGASPPRALTRARAGMPRLCAALRPPSRPPARLARLASPGHLAHVAVRAGGGV